jgi:protoheme IX farnesyltransferase
MAQVTPPLQPDADAPALAADAPVLAGDLPALTSGAAHRHSTGEILRDYLALTKPKIISLLLVTAAGGMFLAAQGVPPLPLLAWVWIGGALASGGANAINQQLDRDIDREMRRTRSRPVAGQRVSPRYALAFGIALNVAAFALFATLVNWWAAGLTLLATLIYVFVYTLWLKRSTPNNIVIGGAAGAIPPMVGWAAVTGSVDLPAVYLFAIVFFWTPPHFWALSLLIQSDYERAGVPMLPVVSSRAQTTLHIFLYSIALTGLTLMFGLLPAVGWIYLASAAALGAPFIWLAWRLWRRDQRGRAKATYLYSLAYLALLFVAVMVDSSV